MIAKLLSRFRKRPAFEEPRKASAFYTHPGWNMVLDPMRGGYARDFDPTARLEFGREEWDKTSFFRLNDQQEWFNVWGLYWRKPNAQS